MPGKRVKKEKSGSFSLSLVVVALIAIVAGYFLGNYYIKMAITPETTVQESPQVFNAPESQEPENLEPLSGPPSASPESKPAASQEEESLLLNLENGGTTSRNTQEPEVVPTTDDGLIRVQVGSFTQRPEAMELAKELQADGYATYITTDQPYRVQVGAFQDQSSAKQLVDQLIADGYSQVILQ